MRFDLRTLTDIPEPEDLSTLELAELRELRARLDEVENGLSYARRMVQGRLDTLGIEVDRRRLGGEKPNQVMSRLPRALADRTRPQGTPRPPSDLEPPDWADEILAEVDEYLTPNEMADLPSIGEVELSTAVERIASVERALSETRRHVHERIDRIQEELVDRYRSGASVDDLLR